MTNTSAISVPRVEALQKAQRSSGKLSAFAMAIGLAVAQCVAPAMAEAGGAVSHHVENIHGIDIFYREAGPKTAPVLLLLHGFPSSSHMFRDLIPQLSDKYRVIAPDYPGFGYSGAPKVGEFDYTFDSVANLISELTEKLGATHYVLYMQDYGGPVGFRVALKHPDRVSAIVVQNATLFAEGWYPKVTEPFGPFWKVRSAETEAPMRSFLKAETTKWQYTQGATRTDRLSPDAWTHDQARLDRPGIDAIQLQYLWNYQDNLAQYPAWQAWLKTKQPPTLVVWGKGDPFFTMAGVDALKAIVPKATVNTYDAGHFALETHGPEIAAAMRDFLAKLPN